ncbi:GNAT family N-acetyltransferase [Ruania halotolerans]|uniref:GNAT family N-acetyltransferase n=1 Tax=Ruania halotolerans TaxID=2897773 RepID=UPI001E35E7E9|nr:GNAT family N-acetyltransferase [Ruania halotolerans]UFU06918.1 GNAT family N-acetyltransferase [Ruania halotolerans]
MSIEARTPCDIRTYRSPDDATATFDVFQTAIRQTAASVYEPDQVEAWAGPARTDLSNWDTRRREAATLVAEVEGAVVGFADLTSDGLVDMVFVHPRVGGKGIARALLTAVIRAARARGLTELRTFASRSAQPAFERLGFVVVADRPDNMVRGVAVPNAEMRRNLA